MSGGGTWTQGSGTLSVACVDANFSVTNFVASGVGNTVNYTGAFNQNIRRPVSGGVFSNIYHNLSLSGTNTKTLLAATTLNGNVIISSALDVSASNFALNVRGNWTSTGTFTPRSGLVTFNGTTTQTITRTGGETFNQLTIAGSGIKQLGSAITTNSNLIISSTLDVTASNHTINPKLNFTNNGTFTARNGLVNCNGTTAQIINGTTVSTFNNLTVNNSTGVSLGTNENIRGTLTVTAGNFTTTGRTFILISDAAGTARVAAIPGTGATANIVGNITMQRFLSSSLITDWRLLGTAVSGTTLSSWSGDFITAGFPGSNSPNFGWVSVYSYNEGTALHRDSGFVAPSSIMNPVNPGQGRMCYVGPSPITIDVTGPPGKFTKAIPVSFTSSFGATHDGWNLVSNPYPSTIDWTAAGWTKTNMSNEIHIWNPGSQTYATFIGGVGANGGTQFIPSTEGFWVKASAAGPALSATETTKSAVDQAFFKTTTQSQANLLRLSLTGNGYTDEAVVYFDNNATTAIDSDFDALKLTSMNAAVPNISSLVGNDDVVINGQPFPPAGTIVPLRTTVGVTGTYTISIDSSNSLSPATCLLLEDQLTGIITDLTITKNYSFSISDTTKTPRFLLRIGGAITKNRMMPTCNGNTDGNLIANGIGSGPFTYSWTDSNNQVIQTSTNIFGGDTLKNIAAGDYNVSITGNSGNCPSLQDTFRLTEPAIITETAQITEVVCQGQNNGSITIQSISGGTSPYTYLWNDGTTNNTIANLSTGSYSLSIIDAMNCQLQTSFNVVNASSLNGAFVLSADTLYLNVNGQLNTTDLSTGAISYFWDFGDGNTSGISNPVNIYTTPGIYQVSMTVTDLNCSQTIIKTVVVLLASPTGINNALTTSGNILLLTENEIYQVQFNLKEETEIKMTLTDVQGKLVSPEQRIKVRSQRINVNLTTVSAGIYFLSIIDKEKIKTFKLIK